MSRSAVPDRYLAAAVDAASSKKAEAIVVLDLRGLSDVADSFVICHGRSHRQTQSIADEIERVLRLLRRRPGHVEGYARGEWILLDYLDFVIHVFTAERRSYYGLERLWGDAPRIEVGSDRGRARRTEAARGDGDGSTSADPRAE